MTLTKDELAPLLSYRNRAMVRTQYDSAYRFMTIRFDETGAAYVVVGFRSKCREYIVSKREFRDSGEWMFTAQMLKS